MMAELSKECHQKVTQMTLDGKSIGNLRGKVRKALASELAEMKRGLKDLRGWDSEKSQFTIYEFSIFIE